ncbi:MAG: hypothetical protein H7831_00915 [Magnetococcus sp. WYHC-3]
MHLDHATILWIAFGSALILPIKGYLIYRYFARRMRESEAAQCASSVGKDVPPR